MGHIYWVLSFILEFFKLYIIIFKILNFKINMNSLYANMGLIAFSAFSMFIMDVMGVNDNVMTVLLSIFLILVMLFMIEKKRNISLIVMSYLAISVIDVVIAGLICLVLDYNTQMALESRHNSMIMNSISIVLLIIVGIVVEKKRIKKHEYQMEYSNVLSKNIWLIVFGMVAFIIYIVPIQSLGLLDVDQKVKNYSLYGVTVSSIIFFTVCISNLVTINTKIKYERQNKLYQTMLEQQKNYYESMLECEKRTKKFRHDIINHLNCINIYLERDEIAEAKTYLVEMLGKVNSLKATADTGNTTLNIVIDDVWRDVHDIRLNWKGSLPENINILYIDICILFSNLLKNAIRAAGTSNKEKFVNAEIRILGKNIYIIVENPFEGDIEFRNGRPVTTKKDSTQHGFGILNIEEVVKKYNGSIEYKTNDNFVVEIVMENIIK